MGSKAAFRVAGVLIALSAGMAWYSIDEPRPSFAGLVADSAVVELGEVLQAEKVHGRFLARNAGNSPIEIFDVFKSCDCTKPTIERSALQPGQTSKVDVEWNVGAARGQTTRLLSLAYRLEGESRLYALDLRLSAMVRPDFNYEPQRLAFRVDDRATHRQSVTLTCEMAELAEIVSAYVTHGSFECNVLQRLASPEGGAQIEVAFHPDRRAYWDEGELILETTSERQPQVRVPLVLEGE